MRPTAFCLHVLIATTICSLTLPLCGQETEGDNSQGIEVVNPPEKHLEKPSVTSFFSHSQNPLSVYKNNQGVEFLTQERFFEGYTKLLEAVQNDPRSEIVHLNLGLSFEQSEEKEKAIGEYLSAAQLATDPVIQFFAYFNAARALGELKKIDEALSTYQKALDIKPDSVEVKTNIELLLTGGGGGGKGGDQKDQNQKQDSQGQQQKQDQGKDPERKEGQDYQPPKAQPKTFQSKELTPNDAKKILEEIKRQEEDARSRFKPNKSKMKEENGKDW